MARMPTSRGRGVSKTTGSTGEMGSETGAATIVCRAEEDGMAGRKMKRGIYMCGEPIEL